MVTFTTLAESKRAAPLSEQDTPRIGSATARATESERLRRAAQMSLASRAATVGCDAEVQLTIPTVVVEAAGAATAAAAGVAARATGASSDAASSAPAAGASSRMVRRGLRSGQSSPRLA